MIAPQQAATGGTSPASEPALFGVAHELPAGFRDPMHSHARGQLLYAATGVMSVIADRMSLLLPPNRAIWLPAGTGHELQCRGAVSLRAIYMDEAIGDVLGGCCVLEVTGLLKALILEMVTLGLSPRGQRAEAIQGLLLTELQHMERAPYRVPMPGSPRLYGLCQSMLQDPGDRRGIDQWAQAAGMSRRTFNRTFRRETGMTVILWRQQVRLMHAISLLQEGMSVTRVAYDIGYESSSYFTTMFQRAFGMPPAHFVSRGGRVAR